MNNPHEVPQTVLQLIDLPRWVFGITFFLGTFLLLMYLVSNNDEFITAGIIYVITALATNILFVLIMIVYAAIYKQYAAKLLINTSLILLNIPVAVFYSYIILNLNQI
jgi:hypothetical protein